MAEHTKLPWVKEYDNDTGPNDEGFWEWVQVGPARISLSRRTNQRAQDEADAELVLRAVNAHEQLVAALRFYMAICGNTAYQVSRKSAQEAYALGQNALRAAGEEL